MSKEKVTKKNGKEGVTTMQFLLEEKNGKKATTLSLKTGMTLQIFYQPPPVGVGGKADNNNNVFKKVPLIQGPSPNLIYALFPEDDVDFEIVMDNRRTNRNAFFQFLIHGVKLRANCKEGDMGMLECLESDGRKFHFRAVPQNSHDEKKPWSYPPLQNLDDKLLPSRMKIGLVYSKKVPKSLKPNEGLGLVDRVVAKLKKITWNCSKDWTLLERTFNRQADDYEGGPAVVGGPNFYRAPNLKSDENDGGGGTEGVICFGEKCGKHFRRFFFSESPPPDPKIEVQPLVIEVRMDNGKSKEEEAAAINYCD